jgi:hypothetical protein
MKKNFNNSVRKTAKMLAIFERQAVNKIKDNVSKDNLLALLELPYQAQKIILKISCKLVK